MAELCPNCPARQGCIGTLAELAVFEVVAQSDQVDLATGAQVAVFADENGGESGVFRVGEGASFTRLSDNVDNCDLKPSSEVNPLVPPPEICHGLGRQAFVGQEGSAIIASAKQLEYSS